MRGGRSADLRPDLRLGETWTRAQAWKNDVIYGMIRVALAITRRLPASVLRALGRAIGAAALVVFTHARRTANANVARVLPRLGPRERRALVRRCYGRLGAHLGDAAALLAGRALAELPMDDASREVLADAQREGRGVVFASAHLGPWERVAATLVARGIPLTTIARESYDPRIDVLYDRLRGGAGVGVIYRGRPGAAARIVRTLKRGQVLGAPMDLRARVPSIDAPFLGHVAPTAVGPARIALRTGAAVVVGTVAPACNCGVVLAVARISPHAVEGKGAARACRCEGLVLACTRIPTRGLEGDDDAQARALTARINDELSRRILALPAEWLWMHPRFV